MALLGLASGAPLLAACAAPAPAQPTAAPAAKPAESSAPKPTEAPAAKPASTGGGPVTITIHFSDGGTYGAFVEKYSNDVVVKKIPNIKIEMQRSPSHDEHFTKLLSLNAAGRLGDLAYNYPAQGWLGTFSAKGMFADHDEAAKADKYDLKQFFDSAILRSRVDGVLRSLPWHAHAEHWDWFMNLDMFKEAGVTPPPMEPPYEWTIDKEVDMGLKLTKRTGDKVDRFGISATTDYLGLLGIVRAFGGEFLSEDGRKVLLGEKPARAALQWEYDRMYKHKYTPTAAQLEGNEQQMFIAGKLAVFNAQGSAGPSMFASIGNKFKMGVAAGPVGPAPTGRSSAAPGPNDMGLLNASKNKEIAWEVLKLHVSQDAGVQKVLSGAGAPGGRPDCYEDPKLLEAFPGAKVVKWQLGFAWPEWLPWNLRGREMTVALEQNLQNVWLNSVAVDAGIDKTIKAMEDVLALTDVRKE
jgi:ABC-type glycerol-3-phosphate transport system substrate-binding protein